MEPACWGSQRVALETRQRERSKTVKSACWRGLEWDQSHVSGFGASAKALAAVAHQVQTRLSSRSCFETNAPERPTLFGNEAGAGGKQENAGSRIRLAEQSEERLS